MLALIGLLGLVLLVVLAVRLWIVLPARVKGTAAAPQRPAVGTRGEKKKKSCKTMVVLGSGGHTAEMLQMLGLVTEQHSPRHYVVAATDTMSTTKALAFEEARPNKSEVWSSVLLPSPHVRLRGFNYFFTFGEIVRDKQDPSQQGSGPALGVILLHHPAVPHVVLFHRADRHP